MFCMKLTAEEAARKFRNLTVQQSRRKLTTGAENLVPKRAQSAARSPLSTIRIVTAWNGMDDSLWHGPARLFEDSGYLERGEATAKFSIPSL